MSVTDHPRMPPRHSLRAASQENGHREEVSYATVERTDGVKVALVGSEPYPRRDALFTCLAWSIRCSLWDSTHRSLG